MLPDRVQRGRKPPQAVIWKREDGSAQDLAGATLGGMIRNRSTNETRAIAGSLTVTDPTAGAFRWDMAAADVAETGAFDVQFTATFGSGDEAQQALTFVERWNVRDSLE